MDLHVLRRQPDIEVVGLLTASTVNSTVSPCTARAVRCSKRKPKPPTCAVDRPAALALLQRNLRGTHGEACQRAVSERIDAIAFGDLFLPTSAPIAKPNSSQPDRAAVSSMGDSTDELAHTMIAAACAPS